MGWLAMRLLMIDDSRANFKEAMIIGEHGPAHRVDPRKLRLVRAEERSGSTGNQP
jgi:hypothetical protein